MELLEYQNVGKKWPWDKNMVVDHEPCSVIPFLFCNMKSKAFLHKTILCTITVYCKQISSPIKAFSLHKIHFESTSKEQLALNIHLEPPGIIRTTFDQPGPPGNENGMKVKRHVTGRWSLVTHMPSPDEAPLLATTTLLCDSRLIITKWIIKYFFIYTTI